MRNSRHKFKDILYRPEKTAYLFLAPSFLLLLVFVVIPLGVSLFLSFTNTNIFLTKHSFVGIKNFSKALSTKRVVSAFGNSLYYAALSVPAQVFVGLVVAVILQNNSLFNRIARSVLFVPVVCSMTCIALVWSMLLDPTVGLIPYYMTKLGLPPMTFLKDPNMAMPVLAFITIWKGFGFNMVIIGAGLTGISPTYYEAARMDGASALQQFVWITIPLLLSTLGFCIVNGLISALQMFDIAYVTTGGGPMQRTESAVMYIYSRAFSQPYEIGYASAIAVLLFVLIAGISLLINGGVQRKEQELYGREGGKKCKSKKR